MAEFCTPCRDVLKIFTDRVGNAVSSKCMERSETITIIRYIIHCSDSRSCCRCLIRNLNIFWSAVHYFCNIFNLMAHLVDKLNEDCLLFDEMQQLITSSSKEGTESDDTIDDLQIDGFTVKDRSELARCCAVLLSDNFSLYTAYQRHYGHIPVRFANPSGLVKKHFLVGNLSAPVIFMLNALIESKLLQRVVTCMSSSKVTVRPEIFANLVLVFLTVKQYSIDSTSRRYLWPIRDLISSFVCGLVENNDNQNMLRNPSIRQLSEQVWSLGREYISNNGSLDTAGLNLSSKHLASHFLAARMAGLHQICVTINHSEEHESENSTDCLGDYLRSNQIVQLIFGPSLHVELIKQSHILLSFMAMQGVLTKADLDSIWAAAMMKHCNRQVLDLLITIVKCLEADLIGHLYDLLKSMKPSEHNDLTLQLAFYVIKSMWSLWLVQNFRETHHRHYQQHTKVGHCKIAEGHSSDVNVIERLRTAFSSVDSRSTDSFGADLPPGVESKDIILKIDVDGSFDDNNLTSAAPFSPIDRKSLAKNEPAPANSSELIRAGKMTCETPPKSNISHEQKSSNYVADKKLTSVGEKGPLAAENSAVGNDQSIISSKTAENEAKNAKLGQISRNETQSDETIDDDDGAAKPSVEISRLKLAGRRSWRFASRGDDNLFPSTSPSAKHLLLKANKTRDDENKSKTSKATTDQRICSSLNGSNNVKKAVSDSSVTEGDNVKRFERIDSSAKKRRATPPSDTIAKRGCGDDDNAGGGHAVPSVVVVEDDQPCCSRSLISRARVPAKDDSRDVERIGDDDEPEENDDDDEDYTNEEERRPTSTPSSAEAVMTPDGMIFVKRRGQFATLTALENNALFEELVKNKVICCRTKSNSAETDSNGSSDFIAPSDRMGDFDDEELVEDEDSQDDPTEIDNAMLSERKLQELKSHCLIMNEVLHQRRFLSRQLPPKIKLLTSVKPEKDWNFSIENPFCKVGHTLLWDLLVNENSDERLSLELEELCLQYIQDLFISQPYMSRQFIEACMQNLQLHKSAFVSTKLLIRLFNSFRQINASQQSALITFWSDFKCDLITIIIEDLHACSQNRFFSRYGEEAEAKARLNLLDLICANRNFFKYPSLSFEQFAVLWRSLYSCESTRKILYAWVVDQLTNRQKCAVMHETVEMMLTNEASLLNVNNLCATGLLMLQALLKDNPSSRSSIILPLMWQVALKNADTNVAVTAMQLISNHYAYDSAAKEQEFVEWCMRNLKDACFSSESNSETIISDSSLVVIHRAINLLYSHIEVLQKKYSFAVRVMELEGCFIATSHFKKLQKFENQQSEIIARLSFLIALYGNNEAATSISLSSCISVAEFKAEVMYAKFRSTFDADISLTDLVESFLRLKADAKIYLNDRELNDSFDMNTLLKIGAKEDSLVLVQLPPLYKLRIHDTSDPSLDNNGSVLFQFLSNDHWNLLLDAIEKLEKLASTAEKDLSFRCKSYAARAWQVVQLLPTSVEVERRLKDIFSIKDEAAACSSDEKLNSFFNRRERHRFLFALQVLEMNMPKHKAEFIRLNGPKLLLDALLTDQEITFRKEAFDLWSMDIMISLLRLLHACIISSNPKADDSTSVVFAEKAASINSSTCALAGLPVQKVINKRPRDRLRFASVSRAAKKKKLASEVHFDAALIDAELLLCLPVADLVSRLLVIIRDIAMERICGLYTSSNARLIAIDYCFKLLFSLYRSTCEAEIALLATNNLSEFLADTLLNCNDASVRREVAGSLHKLTHKDNKSRALARKLIVDLLSILDIAEQIVPSHLFDAENKDKLSDSKESPSASTKNYFWLLVTLLDHENEISAEESCLDPNSCQNKILDLIRLRPIYENRTGRLIDHTLVGLLQLATSITKLAAIRRNRSPNEQVLNDVFDLAFLPPTKQCSDLPKCKTQTSRMAAFDLMVEMIKISEANYLHLHNLLMQQNSKESHASYPWDYWPKDERRSSCGFVGITNLGATCYMASALQHLFMIPQFRNAILTLSFDQVKEHQLALKELQKLFTFLSLSERKSYNPKTFCKNYTMNHQPLNVTDQKDMNEFFTDLITKVDEMSPDLRKLVKNLFGGIMSNNVLSLDCCHVSETTEIFYSVRCPVADMKNLYDSLNSMTLADMLEGDNMYTCSQCNKKVKAEKRACFKQLPRILCFNTLRYTFNMVTMTKEKVNTHFSFPMRLSMAPYMEKSLLPSRSDNDETASEFCQNSTEYELIGITVHTGTADGGHYYSFIKDKSIDGLEIWYSFNDAEVKQWDPVNIDAECFGGELTKPQFDSMSERFMDLPFEKTNSAYMLFYERIADQRNELITADEMMTSMRKSLVPAEFEEMIFDDNTKFVTDTMFFDHSYFELLSQICWHVPGILIQCNLSDLTLLSSKLGLSFLLETLIHSKEKPTFTNWTEFVIKHLSASPAACTWLLDYSSQQSNWILEILIGCPQRVIREMFQKLCMHAILQLQLRHERFYLLPWQPGMNSNSVEPDAVGRDCPVTQFIRRLLSLMSLPEMLDSRQLNEYFSLLIEFGQSCKMAAKFLLLSSTLSSIVTFYTSKRTQEKHDFNSEDESDEDNGLLLLMKSACNMRSMLWPPNVLDKMIKLLVLLLQTAFEDERSTISIRDDDWTLLSGPKGLMFLTQMISDSPNSDLCGTMIMLICHLSPELTPKIIGALFECLQSSKDEYADGIFAVINFIMQQTVQGASLQGGDLDVVEFIIEKIWQLSSVKPLIALKWFERNVSLYDEVYSALKARLAVWTNAFLFKATNCSVRHCAAEVLIASIQCPVIKQVFHQICQKSIVLSPRDPMPSHSIEKMHEIYKYLLDRLPDIELYADPGNSTQRLVSYFNVLKACLASDDEKAMVVPYFNDLWRLYHTYMCEKQVKINANKQGLLTFWFMASLNCTALIQVAVQNAEVSQHFMYTYIFNHNEDEQIEHNKKVLHAFYGLVRLFAQHSSQFAESVALHENFDFACRSISISDHLINAKNEIFSITEICLNQLKDQPEKYYRLRAKICSIYLPLFSTSKSHCFTCLRFLRLFDANEDRLFLLQNHILSILCNNLFGIHEMHHNATGCCCVTELTEILHKLLDFLKLLELVKESNDVQSESIAAGIVREWTNMRPVTIKLLELLNSYNPAEMRKFSIECLKRIVPLCESDFVKKIVTIILQSHRSARADSDLPIEKIGPYFPHRINAANLFSHQHLRKVHPPRPHINMTLNPMLIESVRGVDLSYDQSLSDFFVPYHTFVDRLLRIACNIAGPDRIDATLIVECSCLLGLDGLRLHLAFFAKFWLDLFHKFQEGKDVKELLNAFKDCAFLREYVETVLTLEQHSLVTMHLYNFVRTLIEKMNPSIVQTSVRRSAIETALNVLNTANSSQVSLKCKADIDKLALMFARCTGALRVLLLLHQSFSSGGGLCETVNKFESTLAIYAAIQAPLNDNLPVQMDEGSSALNSCKRHVLDRFVSMLTELIRELKKRLLDNDDSDEIKRSGLGDQKKL